MNLSVIGAGLLAIATTFVITACDGLSGTRTASKTIRNYSGAGSKWNITLTDVAFTMTRSESITSATVDLELAGTVERNESNQFLTLTVVSSSKTGEVSEGVKVLGLEIPDTGVFIKVPDHSTPLVAVVGGSCPTSTIYSNWVITKPMLDPQNSNTLPETSFDSDGAGTVEYTGASFTVTQSGINNRTLDTDNQTVMSLVNQNCADGLLPVDFNGEVFDMFFTPSGFQIVKFPQAMGEQIIFGLPRADVTVNPSSIADTYSAFVYRGGSQPDLSTSTITPAQVEVNSSGYLNVQLINDVDNDTLGATVFTTTSFGTSFTVSSGTHSSNGLFYGSTSSNEKMTCATAMSGNTKILACYGFEGVSPNREPVTIIGHSR